jgi:hypothetical protein
MMQHTVQAVFNYNKNLPNFMEAIEEVWRSTSIAPKKTQDSVIASWKAGNYPLSLDMESAKDLAENRKSLNKPDVG